MTWPQLAVVAKWNMSWGRKKACIANWVSLGMEWTLFAPWGGGPFSLDAAVLLQKCELHPHVRVITVHKTSWDSLCLRHSVFCVHFQTPIPGLRNPAYLPAGTQRFDVRQLSASLCDTIWRHFETFDKCCRCLHLRESFMSAPDLCVHFLTTLFIQAKSKGPSVIATGKLFSKKNIDNNSDANSDKLISLKGKMWNEKQVPYLYTLFRRIYFPTMNYSFGWLTLTFMKCPVHQRKLTFIKSYSFFE